MPELEASHTYALLKELISIILPIGAFTFRTLIKITIGHGKKHPNLYQLLSCAFIQLAVK